MATIKIRAASMYVGGVKIAEFEGTTYDLEGGDEEQFGDPGFLGYTDGAITTKLSATGVHPVAGMKVDLITPFLNKQDIDVGLTLINGRIHQITMRILKCNVKSSHKNGSQAGDYSFGGGEPVLV